MELQIPAARDPIVEEGCVLDRTLSKSLWRTDLRKTGANTAEVLLNPKNVNTTTFGKVFEYRVDGPVIAQPLIASNILIGNIPRNVLIVATISNWVYAFDADMRSSAAGNSNALWRRK